MPELEAGLAWVFKRRYGHRGHRVPHGIVRPLQPEPDAVHHLPQLRHEPLLILANEFVGMDVGTRGTIVDPPSQPVVQIVRHRNVTRYSTLGDFRPNRDESVLQRDVAPRQLVEFGCSDASEETYRHHGYQGIARKCCLRRLEQFGHVGDSHELHRPLLAPRLLDLLARVDAAPALLLAVREEHRQIPNAALLRRLRYERLIFEPFENVAGRDATHRPATMALDE